MYEALWFLLGVLAGGLLACVVLLKGKRKPDEELPEVDPPTVQLRKITIPSFGKPGLRIYAPGEFEIPLVCTSCTRVLREGELYYETPIVNAEDGVVAVHHSCFLLELAEMGQKKESNK